MAWNISITKRARKQAERLPEDIRLRFNTLIVDLQNKGCYQPQWQNYSKLSVNRFHCHIKCGKPTYVVVWELQDKELRIIEVNYVGTHEKAPY